MLSPTRRSGLVVIAAVVAVALTLGGCARTADSEATTPSGTGWSFTDDLGKTVSLDAAPTRVAGLNDVVYSLLNYGVKPVASFGWKPVATDQRFEGLDIAGITDLGVGYGEIDVEKLAAAAPQLIVTYLYPSDSSGTLDGSKALYGFKDLAQQKQVEAIAPVVTIGMRGSAADVIQRVTAFAEALGARPEVIAKSRTTFEAASTELTAAAASGRVTQVLYAEAANVYVAKAPDDPGLRLYASLGMTFTPGRTKDYYWDIISWEKYDTADGDLVLYSLLGLDKAALMKQPTFAATAPARAGQVYPWVLAGMDYASQAAYMTQLATWLKGAKSVG